MNIPFAYADDCFLLRDVHSIEAMIPIALEIQRCDFSARIAKCKFTSKWWKAVEFGTMPIQKDIVA
jgi:hypothetical protein